VMNKFLHGPTVHLRNGGGSDPHSLDLVQRLFFSGRRKGKEAPPGPARPMRVAEEPDRFEQGADSPEARHPGRYEPAEEDA